MMLALTLIAGMAVDAGLPVLAKPVMLFDGTKPIAVGVGHADPWVYDWDRDGKKDLLVGEFEGGYLRIYLNKGTDATPRFDGFKHLEVAGKKASIPPS